MLNQSQRDRISVVLVSPRNPLNIGAVARAMANFGFSRLAVVAPYEPHWHEAKSAVGSAAILQDAKIETSIADAVRECMLVLGTGTLTHRKPEQPVVRLDAVSPIVNEHLTRGGRIAVVFGPEKHGLTREDLSYCHFLVQIPTEAQQPSMNLGQAAAVCLYELAAGEAPPAAASGMHAALNKPDPDSGRLDVLGGLIEAVMVAADYSPRNMQAANRHDLRLLLRRLHLSAADHRRILGLFRRILWRLKHHHRNVTL